MNDAPKPKRKLTWLWIILGVLFVLFVAAVSAVFIAASYVRQNVTLAQNVDEAEATRAFDAALAKFPGQQPLIRLVDGRPQYVGDRATQNPSSKPLTTMHVIMFDRDDDEMATLSLPFWLLRMKSGPIELSAYNRNWDDRGVRFTIEDLEKAGPGIVMDLTRERDGRMLVWVE